MFGRSGAARLAGSRGAVVGETAFGRWRLVEAACRAFRTVGARGGAVTEFAASRRAVASVAPVPSCVASCAGRTIGAVAIAALDGLGKASLAALAFGASRRAVAARSALAAAAVLRGAAVCAEAGAVGSVAFTTRRTLATLAAFRGTPCSCPRAAGRTAFAVEAARGAAVCVSFETARRAVGAARAILETARCAFAAFSTWATGRPFAVTSTVFKAAGRAVGAT
ncbi:hypothetical protein [uncultured Paraburkholderia sp.]|uniref:hypothetical protein n=1 Tax=uncultured Paraburkholderia sp. TaxID=1822466 RepID=UPI0025925869|nr:hypothetical protein [uncultured Paraburkholderia sp.]